VCVSTWHLHPCRALARLNPERHSTCCSLVASHLHIHTTHTRTHTHMYTLTHTINACAEGTLEAFFNNAKHKNKREKRKDGGAVIAHAIIVDDTPSSSEKKTSAAALENRDRREVTPASTGSGPLTSVRPASCCPTLPALSYPQPRHDSAAVLPMSILQTLAPLGRSASCCVNFPARDIGWQTTAPPCSLRMHPCAGPHPSPAAICSSRTPRRGSAAPSPSPVPVPPPPPLR